MRHGSPVTTSTQTNSWNAFSKRPPDMMRWCCCATFASSWNVSTVWRRSLGAPLTARSANLPTSRLILPASTLLTMRQARARPTCRAGARTFPLKQYLPPQALNPMPGNPSVMGGELGITVPEVILHGAQVGALVGQVVAARNGAACAARRDRALQSRQRPARYN